jgi:hypothetical protein
VCTPAAKDFSQERGYSDPIGPKAVSGMTFSSVLTLAACRESVLPQREKKQNALKASPQAASSQICFAQRPRT